MRMRVLRMRISVVEDNNRLAGLVASGLRKRGFGIDVVVDLGMLGHPFQDGVHRTYC